MTVLKISDAALATDVPADTIRYYEKIGLLAPAARGDNKYRGYGPAQVERLRFIRACRQLDMSVAEIAQVLAVRDDPAAPCDAAVAVMREHLQHVKGHLARLRLIQRELQKLLDICSGGSSASCEVLGALDARDPRSPLENSYRSSTVHLRSSHG